MLAQCAWVATSHAAKMIQRRAAQYYYHSDTVLSVSSMLESLEVALHGPQAAIS